MISFGFLVVACGGADSSLFDPAATTSSTDPVATDDASAPPVTLPTEDAGSDQTEADADAAAQTCTGYADPDTKGTCHACTGSSCQANGCFGGWYCKLDTQKCVSKPDGC